MVLSVRTDRANAEHVRQDLVEQGLLADTYEIQVRDGQAYIPVTGEPAGDYELVDADLDSRHARESVDEILGYSPTYEWIGNVVVLQEDDDTQEIVDAFKQSVHSPDAIVNKQTSVEGDERVAEYELLYGDSTETVHTEYGYEYKLDLRRVYFTPRLSNERYKVRGRIDSEDKTFDMFAGVGPYTIPAADVGAEAVGVDINNTAVAYLRENADRNSVSNAVRARNENVRDVAPAYSNWADNIVMNLPHSADEYIDAAIEVAHSGTRIFYYDFMSEQESIEEVVHSLNSTVEPTLNLDRWRTVRPYAPSVQNVCVELIVDEEK